MANSHHTYMGPGANIWPAMKYLKSKGATSEAKAISIEDIESEDFKQLIKLNAQTSMWIGVTPDGKYWYRAAMRFLAIIPIFIILLLMLYIAVVSSGILSFGNNLLQDNSGRIQELRDSN